MDRFTKSRAWPRPQDAYRQVDEGHAAKSIANRIAVVHSTAKRKGEDAVAPADPYSTHPTHPMDHSAIYNT